jgi:hypothetical protein
LAWPTKLQNFLLRSTIVAERPHPVKGYFVQISANLWNSQNELWKTQRLVPSNPITPTRGVISGGSCPLHHLQG